LLDCSRQYSIISATRKLVGSISAKGDSQEDKEVLENLEQVDYLLNDFIETLCNNVSIGENSYEGSVQDVGAKSQAILHGLRDWL